MVIALGLVAVLVIGAPAGHAQMATRVAEPVAAAATAADGAAGSTGAAAPGLDALNAMTFDCPRAALNAAAREAAQVPSQGTYQFAYFTIVSASHHAAYEVRFTSNYPGEKDLDYCVAIYCQQGWDAQTTKTSVTLLTPAPPKARSTTHAAACGHRPGMTRRPR
jgi:hypothetical protein